MNFAVYSDGCKIQGILDFVKLDLSTIYNLLRIHHICHLKMTVKSIGMRL